MWSGRSRARAVACFAVLALHLALLGLLIDSSAMRAAREPSSPPPTRITLRLITPPPAAAPAPAVGEPPQLGRLPKPKPMPMPTAAPPTRNSAAQPPANTPAFASPPQEAAARAEPAASAQAPLPSLLDTEATRRAIRASARTESLGDQLAGAREEPERAGAQARLANGVKSAGKGDCLKGEYAGGGMGLLSLPFLAIAQARGDCAK